MFLNSAIAPLYASYDSEFLKLKRVNSRAKQFYKEAKKEPAYAWRIYMGNNIIDAHTVKLKSTDKLLFDCNVLMYIFYTYGGYSPNQISVYKTLFKEAIKENCEMYIPSIEISEFVNTYVRNEYTRYLRRKNLTDPYLILSMIIELKKDYINTISDIKNIINNQILPLFNKLNDDFSQLDLIFTIFQNGLILMTDIIVNLLKNTH